MAATSYDSLLPHILTEAVDVAYPTAISAINLAVRRLCQESSCWFDYEDIPLYAGVSDYDLSAPSAKSLVRNVRSVMHQGVELKPVPEQVVARDMPWLLTQSGSPAFYYIIDETLIRLMPAPSANEAGASIRVKASFVPALEATAADSSLIDRYAETIIAGAKSRIMAMVGTTWFNPDASAHYRAEFERGIAMARIDSETSRGMADMKVARRSFGK